MPRSPVIPYDSHEERRDHWRVGGLRDSDRRLRRLSLGTSLALGQVRAAVMTGASADPAVVAPAAPPDGPSGRPSSARIQWPCVTSEGTDPRAPDFAYAITSRDSRRLSKGVASVIGRTRVLHA
jgi:hypothetical protein